MTRPRFVYAATTNPGKVRELARLLEPTLRLRPPPPGFVAPEESGATYAENALAKARALAAATGAAALADDSGLEVDALDGRPGVRSARYGADDAERIARLLRELRGVPTRRRTARFRCVLAFVRPEGQEILVEGVAEGRIAARPRGRSGFGYDPVFVASGTRRTFAELAGPEKDALSHRGRALRELRRRLEEEAG